MADLHMRSWRVLWHDIRVHLDAATQRRAELIVMRGMDRHWSAERLRRLLKILLEKACPVADCSERRQGLRDHGGLA